MKVWQCKLVLPEDANLPDGADLPMRQALQSACEELTGQQPIDIFSGWGGKLTKIEQRLVRSNDF